LGTRKLLYLDKEENEAKPEPIILCSGDMREKACFQKKKIIGNSCRPWLLKIEDISKSQNKCYRDDLILNLKRKFNLAIREIAEILVLIEV